MMEVDMLERTKAGLETGLSVRHITTYKLETRDIDDDIAGVFSDPRLQGFDCIPVRMNGVICGYVWRSPGLTGSVRQHMRPLTEGVLVSADLPLTQFVPRFADEPYRLVLDGASIQGIVTWSDLQKLPVRLFVFSLITYLEMVMAQAIQSSFQADGEWLQLINSKRREKIEEKRQLLWQKNLEPPLVELTDFCDKRDILAGRFGLDEQFVRQLKAIEELRNTTAHAGTYAEDQAAVRAFVHNLKVAEQWITYFARPNSEPNAQVDENV